MGPLTALMMGMVLWINSLGMIAPVEPTLETLPSVEYVDIVGMLEDVEECVIAQEKEGLLPDTAEEKLQVMEALSAKGAIFCRETNRISIKEGKDIYGEDSFVLLHELVHWVQAQNGDWDTAECQAALEKDAYSIHWIWQAEMDMPTSPDQFTVFVISMCNDRFTR